MCAQECGTHPCVHANMHDTLWHGAPRYTTIRHSTPCHEHTTDTHKRTNARMNARTSARAHERTQAHTHARMQAHTRMHARHGTGRDGTASTATHRVMHVEVEGIFALVLRRVALP